MRTVHRIREQLPASLEAGLTDESVLRSREKFGANRLTPLPREPVWKKFLGKFDEPIIKILLAAALLSMVVDLFASHGDGGMIRYVAAGVVVGLAVIAVAGAYILRKAPWVPGILFISAILLAIVGLATGHPSWDGLAVMIAVILATGVAFASEYKSDREFELLNAHKDAVQVKMQRGGEFRTIPLEDVVVGDIVILEIGDEIPADGRVLKATDLYVDQSLMTGESEPVRKSARAADDTADGPEQPGCIYRGTQIVDGVASMLVTEVGDDTYLGQIARRLSMEDEEENVLPAGGQRESHGESAAAPDLRVRRKLTISKESTPLQEKLEKLAGLISKVGYVAAAAIFVALLVLGINSGEVRWPGPGDDQARVFLDSAGALVRYFMYMVIIIVVAVPEGLPMSVTVSLALAMRKMTRANSLVRQLVACETIGSTTVICSDKTGTLTQNKMQVVRLFWDGQTHDRGTPSWPTLSSLSAPGSAAISSAPLCPRVETETVPTPLPPAAGVEGLGMREPAGASPLDWIILNAAVNSTANLERKEGKLVPVGNSTEAAMLQWLHESRLEYETLRLRFPPLYQVHFSSERKRMTTVTRCGDRLIVLVKGAPEWVMEQTTKYLAAQGETRPWTAPDREQVQAQLRDSAGQAMRTLAFAFAVLPDGTPDDEESLHAIRATFEKDLVFAGFLAIRDPLRDDVKEAIQQCRLAGIEVKMITGDNIETARAIGREIGLLDHPDPVVFTSREFNQLDDEQLIELLPRLRILARARPLDKYRMVRLLQQLNEVVAVTGDGTNDAPALKKADVGLAMGRTGTEVAKEASKIVLLDDAFSTIVKAVHWGRSLYENIQRFIQFQLTINVSALVIAFLGPFFRVKPPFTILQLLWINVIMDTFAAIALCSEPPREGLMRMPPKKRDESIVTRAMLWNIFTTAAFFVVVMLTLLVGMEGMQANPDSGAPEKRGWFAGDGKWSDEFPELTARQVSIFFSLYVMFQVWNEINCRSLVPQTSGLRGVLRNPVFLAIIGTVTVVQAIIVTFGGEVFKVEPLSPLDWLWITVASASVLVFAEVVRRIRVVMR
jgi:Ca2+-transporting ATPase